MHLVSEFVYCAANKSVRHSEESSTMMLFTPLEIWKWHAVLLDIYCRSSNILIFVCQSEGIFMLMRSKHPIYIMLFGVVTNNGNIMLPFIILHGLRLNTEAYIKCLHEVVLSWTKRVAAGRPYVWQQNSVPCQTSGHPNPQIAIPWIVMCSAKFHATPKMNWWHG